MGLINRYIMLDEVTSTNDYLKENYENLENGTVVSALVQTAGKGRLGRKWCGKKGMNIYFSYLLTSFDNKSNFSNVTLLAATSVFKALQNLGVNVCIKWPNDILVGNKKLCGILTEAVSDIDGTKAIIIGIGINVNQISFDEEIKNITTSVKLELGYEVVLQDLLIEIVNNLNNDLEKYLQKDTTYLDIIRNNLYRKGEIIEYTKKGKICTGTICDIASDGCLVVETDNIKYRLLSGEIKMKR